MKTSLNALVAWGFCFAISLVSLLARADGAAEPIPSYYQEAGKSPNRDYVNQHPSEHIDTFTGKLQWHYVDLFIPGNGGFDLKVQRSYSSQGEALPAPSAYGVGWTIHFGKVLRSANLALCDTSQIFSPARNPVLELPDGSRQILYIALDGTSFITTNFWKGVCSGGNLSIYAPDGTRYDMTAQGADEGPVTHPIHAFYASKITDRNNNSMTLTYTNFGVTTGVSTVTTSDGRQLAFSYAGGSLGTVSDGARTWTYTYQASNAMLGQSYLQAVQPPEGNAWRYDYNDSALGNPGAASMQKVTYPTGGTISYIYDFVTFSVSPFLPRSTAVKTKTTSEGGVWTFSYKPATVPLPQTPTVVYDNPDQLDQTTVSGPDGVKVYSHVGYTSASSGWVWSIGLLTGVKTGDVETVGNSWDSILISSQINQRPGGTLTSDGDVGAPINIRHGTTRDGTGFQSEYSGFDPYGNPGTVVETGTEKKTSTITYAVDTGRWILRVKKNESTTNNTTGENVGAITRNFDANLNLLNETRYGVATDYTYTGQGDIATKRDARLKTSVFSNYFRGTPQNESHPEGVSIVRVVDAAGNVTSQTDGESATTGYGYDRLARLTRITHPAGNPAIVTWTPNTRTVGRGGYVEVLTFDGFGRQVREEHQGAGAPIFQTTQYDAAGRATFKSYPSSSSGTTFTFDELGRVKTTLHPSSTGGTTGRTYTYSNGTTRVQNERGLATTYFYRAFGDPDRSDLVAIGPPEATANTVIDRNTLGQPTRVRQSDKERSYTYDSHFFLKTKVDPETGTASYGRDAVGNMISRSVGTSPTTQFAYDDLNRLTLTTYPVGPPVSRTYYRDDKIHTVDTGVAALNYAYDTNKNLVGETLTIGTQVFTTGYGYNANDALDVLTYGSTGKTVTYAPDALGRPTQAAPYVSAVTYHPTGQISSMTHANGVITSVGLNARLWPSNLTIQPAAALILSSRYGYDESGNVLSIADANDASYNRTMTYDGIDRMITAAGSWGPGTFVYDGKGNLRTQRLGGFAIGYSYDPTSDKLTSIAGSKAATYTYDAYGNVTGNGSITFSYDDASNMRCAKCGQGDQSTFDYDGLNMRVRQVKSGVTTYFVYGLDGKLLWEKTPLSNIKEYIYLGGKQVATRQVGISTP